MPPIVLILDTTDIISLGKLLRYYKLFEKLKKAGFKIVIPLYIYEKEIKYPSTRYVVEELIKKDIVEIGGPNSTYDVMKVVNDNERMHSGETHVIFDYQKEEGDIEVYCIFDDKGAQKYAEDNEMKYIPSRDLVLWLKEMRLISAKETEEILKILDKDNKTVAR